MRLVQMSRISPKGDKVGVGWFDGHCGECNSCDKNEWVCCEKTTATGVAIDGGYAEYVGINFMITYNLNFMHSGPI